MFRAMWWVLAAALAAAVLVACTAQFSQEEAANLATVTHWLYDKGYIPLNVRDAFLELIRLGARSWLETAGYEVAQTLGTAALTYFGIQKARGPIHHRRGLAEAVEGILAKRESNGADPLRSPGTQGG